MHVVVPVTRTGLHQLGSHWMLRVLLAFGAVWGGVLALTNASPPADNIAQLLWQQSLEWGYYKHPPLPSWLLRLAVLPLGPHIGTSYLLAAAMNLVSMALLWRLLVRLRGPAFAAVGLLAALCVSYYNARFLVYNHNTLLMLVGALCALASWRACSTGALRWWIVLGLLFGLGLLTKYQIALTMASVLAFWLWRGLWREARQRVGLLLATLLALGLFVPHLQWLRTHDFGPIGYAMHSSLAAQLGPWERIGTSANWLADQLLNRALPAWLMLALLAAWQAHRGARASRSAPSGAATLPADHARGARAADPHESQRSSAWHADPASRAFLLIWGLLPLALVALIGLFAGSELVVAWGFPYLLFTVPALMELTGASRWSDLPATAVVTVFLLVQALLLTLSLLGSVHGPAALRDQHWRNFDSAALARQLAAPLRAALGDAPVAIVSGPEGLAGALALQLPGHPAVLIDGRLDHSPWITPARLRGATTLQIERGSALPGGTRMDDPFGDVWWRLDRPARPAPAPAHAGTP